MSKPTFMVGEIILSETLMGKIVFAGVEENEWIYYLEDSVDDIQPLKMKQADVKEVLRDGRWYGK